ncbi:MAG: hypothetical protein ACRCTS_01215 [Fusobacteriaceae bacterium]
MEMIKNLVEKISSSLYLKEILTVICFLVFMIFVCGLASINTKKEYRFKQADVIKGLIGIIGLNLLVEIYYQISVWKNIIFFMKLPSEIGTKMLSIMILSINFIFLILFFILKLSICKFIKKDTLENYIPFISSPYEKKEEKAFIKEHWILMRETMGILRYFIYITVFGTIYGLIENMFRNEVSPQTDNATINGITEIVKNLVHPTIFGNYKVSLFVILTLIFITELYYYLDGNEYTAEEKEKELEKVEKKEMERREYESLYRRFKDIWSENILADSLIQGKEREKEEKQKIPKALKDNKEASEVYSYLNKEYDLNSDYTYILKELFEKKDIIISDSNHEEFAPILFSYFEKSIIKGKKILILAENSIYNNDSKREELQNWYKGWFRKLYKKSIRNIVTFEEWKNQNEWDIVIATQNEIIKTQEDFIKKLQKEQNELKDIIIVVLNEKAEEIAENIQTLSILTNILNTHFRIELQKGDEGVQYVILSNSSEGLKASIDKNLKISTVEHHIQKSIPENNYNIIWREDSYKKYYTEIIEGVPKGEIGVSNTLSYLPWEMGIQDINFVENDELPYIVYEGNIKASKNQLRGMPINGAEIKSVYNEVIKNNSIPSLLRKKESNLIFVEDKNYNAPVALRKYGSLGEKNNFVNVISPNYLLRDYFIDNIEYFYISPIEGYTPKIENDKFKSVSYLKEILTNSSLKVSDEDIKIEIASYKNAEISLQNQSIENTESELIELFKQVYNVDILKEKYMSVETQNIYDDEIGKFVEKKFYSLSSIIKDSNYFKWFENFQIMSNKDFIYGVIPLDHVYQNYLPNQYHSFNGHSFNIKKIDLVNKKIDITPTSGTEKFQYRNKEAITIKKYRNENEFGEKKSRQNLSSSKKLGYDLDLTLQMADYSIETLGYYEFKGGINLNNEEYSYKSLENYGHQFKREYENGRVLSVKIFKKRGEIKEPDKVALTLSVILNELFKTLFPGNNRYIKIFTMVNEDILSKENIIIGTNKGYSVPDSLNHIIPAEIKIDRQEFDSVNSDIFLDNMGEENIFESNKDKHIRLHFMEDSHKDVGVLQSIDDKQFIEMLKLVQEYLQWIDGDSTVKKGWNKNKFTQEEREQYLKYGFKNLPEYIDLNLLREFLNDILGEDNEITDARKKFYSKVIEGVTEDDFDKEYNFWRNKIVERRERT